MRRIINGLKYVYHKPHLFYGVVALVFASLFAIITPPFHGPDEDVHFFRSYQIVRGDLVLQRGGIDNNELGTCLPREIHESIKLSSMNPNIRGLTAEKYDPRSINEMLVDGVDSPDDCRFVSTTNTYTYNPLVYTPSVIGISIVNLFNGSPLLAMYLARIVTVLMTVLIFALAIFILPRRKMLFAVLALTPMLVYQQAVVSSDGISYAVLALFFAYVIRLYSVVKINNRQWLVLALLAVAVCFMKPLLYVFVPLVLILFKKDKLKSLLIVVVSVFAILGGMLATSAIYPSAENRGVVGSDGDQQVEMLKENPLRVLRVAWNTYMNPYGNEQTQGLIGLFGYADTKIPTWTYTISVINIAIALLFVSKEDRNKKVSKWMKVLFVLVCAVYFAGVNAAMYVTYSPVGFDIIYGVQGRYFLPILIALPIVVTGGYILGRKDYTKLIKYLSASVIAVLVVCLIVIFQRYYLFTP